MTITEGVRPLAILKPSKAGKLPKKLRVAIIARDKGCRYPGCHAPLRRINVHRRGWKPELDPTTGRVSWTRSGSQRLSSMPHGHRQPPKPDDWATEFSTWRAPPIPPPPDHAPPEWNGIETNNYAP